MDMVKLEPRETESELGEVECLTKREDLINFVLVWHNSNGVVYPEKLKRSIAEQSLKKILADGPTQFYGVKDAQGKLVATGRLSIREKDGEKNGNLSALTVDRTLRGQGIGKKLTDRRIEDAKAAGCTSISTEVFSENPPALSTKLNDGFAITGFKSYAQEGALESVMFIVSKKIDGQELSDKKNGPVGDLKEVILTDITTITQMLADGWKGIDIKNIAEKDNSNPKNWVLILEK